MSLSERILTILNDVKRMGTPVVGNRLTVDEAHTAIMKEINACVPEAISERTVDGGTAYNICVDNKFIGFNQCRALILKNINGGE